MASSRPDVTLVRRLHGTDPGHGVLLRCFVFRNICHGSVSEIEMQSFQEETRMARSATPRPGRNVRGSTTGRPLMAAMDLLGRRWALRILWELRAGPTGARALQAKCDGMSSSVLYDRLRDLAASELVERTHDDQYVLSELGAALGSALEPLETWAKAWATSLRKAPHDG